MPARINIPPGTEFGKLAVISLGDKRGKNGQIYWKCECKCGRIKDIRASHLRSGFSTSCGFCVHRRPLKHGMSSSSEHGVWSHIKGRCLNPNDAAYFRYGGRGIKMHQPWVNDFAAFYGYVGPRPSPQHTLERIENNRGYEPGNVKWATRTEQARNTRGNHLITFRGKTMCVAEWAEQINKSDPTLRMNASALYARLGLDWSIERAFTQPLRQFTGHAGRIATKHKRRARVANNGGSFTAQEWLNLCERFRHCCAACGEKKPLTADHIVPVSKGGSSFISNIQPLCQVCNSRKHCDIIDYRSGKPVKAVQLRLVV